MSEHMSPIPSRVYNAAVGGHVCGPEDLDFGQKVIHLVKYDRDGNEVSFESQVTQANKIYVIHDDFVLSSNVTIPANCVLEFDGGSVSGAYTITGIILNDIVKPDWFGAVKDGVTDCSNAVQNALNVCKSGGIVMFSNGSYAFRNAVIRRNCTIKGTHDSILVGQRLTEGLNGLDYMFKSSDIDEIYLEGFKVTAVPLIEQGSGANPSNPLIYFDTGKKVVLDNILFDSIRTGEMIAPEYYSDGIVLYSILDIDKTVITNCDFKDCARTYGEMTLVMAIQKERKNTRVLFSNNHVYNTVSDGTTVFDIIAGNLTFENNIIENIRVNGSICNFHGDKITITNNIVSNSVATSVFDTCENGTEYSDNVYVSNNVVECLNSIMLAVTARKIDVKENTFKGLSLVKEQVYRDYEQNSSLIVSKPTSELVSVENNSIDCDYYDENEGSLPPIMQGILVGTIYRFAESVSIRHNKIKFTFNTDLNPEYDGYSSRGIIHVFNPKNVIIQDNYIYGIMPDILHSALKKYIFIITSKSIRVPYSNDPCTIESVVANNNTIINNEEDKFIGIEFKVDGFEYLNIKDLKICDNFNTVYASGIAICNSNVGIENADIKSRHFLDNIYKGYTFAKNDPNVKYHISCIIKGHELINTNVNFALSDTCIPDYDSVSDLGKTIRQGSVVSFGDYNWQVLKDVTLASNMGPDNSGTVGEISVFNGVAWRRCPDSRNNFVILQNS